MKLPLFRLAPMGWLGLVCGFWPMTAPAQSTYEPYTFTTLAGRAGNFGSVDGAGSAARFNQPYGVAVDSAGNVFVADTVNSTIRKISPGGTVGTLAGLAGTYGSADGTGSAARFINPQGVATDSAGNVFVADSDNNTIRKTSPDGVVSTLAGSAARFDRPRGVAVDSAGNVFVTDSDNNTIRKVTPAGVVTTLAGQAGSSGSADGTGSAARFFQPYGVAVDPGGNIYVADTLNHTIRKVTAAGVVTTLAGQAGSSGSTDGTGKAARFYYPAGLAVDSAGNVIVADSLNNTIRKVTPAGVVTTLAGLAGSSGSADGTGSAARFDYLQGVAVDSAGMIYVTDTGNSTIRMGWPTISGPPTIILNPASQTVWAGSNVTFSVAAAGTTPLNYQWSFNGNPILNGVNPTLTLTNVQPAQTGQYAVTVANVAGAVTSAVATLTVNLLPAPTITADPVSQIAVAGTNVTFSVVATRTTPLSYQWWFKT